MLLLVRSYFIVRLRFQMAIYEVNVCELILYIITLLAVAVAMIQMRNLKYFRKNGNVIIILFIFMFLVYLFVFLYRKSRFIES